MALPFLPATPGEIRTLGWDQPDVVFVTGDAYVDHPSFAMAILGRVLEAAGFRVAILAQPPWRDASAFRSLGRPRLFFAVSAGNMDSMINRYTANRRLRSDDAYSPGGRAGLRPDRATNVYAQRCREAFPGVPVIAGGVEASLRRLAHYDYWSDTVRPSILVTSKADLVVHGMGERPIVEIARRLRDGAAARDLRDLRGAAWLLGEREELPPADPLRGPATPADDTLVIPSFESVRDDRLAFARATRAIHMESNPWNARRLVQPHERRRVVQNPPDFPLSTAELDRIYDLPFARAPHPSCGAPVPAATMMRTSVTILRGCFGGCTFCSITTHQGRTVQSRSEASILREVRAIAAEGGGGGSVVSDLGGPTANMYRMRCTRPEVEAMCRRLSCVHPTICCLLGTDHGPLIDVMRKTRETPGIRRVHIASGVRMDLARRDARYVAELATHHVGGHLKVAPEHVSEDVLRLMKKPGIEEFQAFADIFASASRRASKEQYLVPYFIASHPGSGLAEMIELAVFLKRQGLRPEQVQDFIPAPLDVATCMYHTGLDPMTMKPVTVARNIRDRRAQRALMQFFLPENWFAVRDALVAAGRRDLIGEGCDALIPAAPPPEARRARMARAARDLATRPPDGHPPARAGRPARSVGYRSHRAGRRRPESDR